MFSAAAQKLESHDLHRPPSPSQTKDGRNGLFGVLQYTEAGNPEVDSWMGHPLVNPKKGKLGLEAPSDATGEATRQSRCETKQFCERSVPICEVKY